MNTQQQLFTNLNYSNQKQRNNTTTEKKQSTKINWFIEFRNISLLTISVSLISLSVINLDAIKVYASDRLGMTQDIVQLYEGEEHTGIIKQTNTISDTNIQNIIDEQDTQQLAIHPVKPIESMLKSKINNYTMPFNTLPPVNKILIPEINVDAPIIANYSKTPEQVAKGDFNDELMKGIAKYPATPNPGQKGHTLLFGHSSSEYRNNSAYNAIFAQLPNLEPGSEFSIVRNGQLYDYHIVEKDIITPSAIQQTYSKRNDDKKNYLTLITCRPIGTTKDRMVVTAELKHKTTENTPSLAYHTEKK